MTRIIALAFAGKQKAWAGALGAFLSTLIMQVTTGQEVDLSTETDTIALLAADLVRSLIAGAVTFVAAYLKRNIAADGTPMQFVKPSARPASEEAVVVDSSGKFKGTLGATVR